MKYPKLITFLEKEKYRCSICITHYLNKPDRDWIDDKFISECREDIKMYDELIEKIKQCEL